MQFQTQAVLARIFSNVLWWNNKPWNLSGFIQQKCIFCSKTGKELCSIDWVSEPNPYTGDFIPQTAAAEDTNSVSTSQRIFIQKKYHASLAVPLLQHYQVQSWLGASSTRSPFLQLQQPPRFSRVQNCLLQTTPATKCTMWLRWGQRGTNRSDMCNFWIFSWKALVLYSFSLLSLPLSGKWWCLEKPCVSWVNRWWSCLISLGQLSFRLRTGK